MTATVELKTPFEVFKRPRVLKARDRKQPALGPKVRVAEVRTNLEGQDTAVRKMIDASGLADTDNDGLLEHSCDAQDMWLGRLTSDAFVEFDLPEPVRIGAIEIWNYNAQRQTTNGIRRADVKISLDGSSWQTVLTGAEIPEAEDIPDYDQPAILQLNPTLARKVRFENLLPHGTGPHVGISEIVFHESAGERACPVRPVDGATAVPLREAVLEWTAVPNIDTYSVHLGTSPEDLKRIGLTQRLRLDLPELKPNTTYYWRVDAVPSQGKIVQGRVGVFQTTGLVAWWRFDETKGTRAVDQSGYQHFAELKGKASWAPNNGRFGGAIEFAGTKGHVQCPTTPALCFRNEMSVSAWVKVRQFDKPNQAILSKSDNSLRIERHGEHDVIRFVLMGPAPATGAKTNQIVLVSQRILSDGQWHHVAATYDGHSAVLYLDGVAEDSVSATGQLVQDFNSWFVIGANLATPQREFNGWIDEVRFYGYAIPKETVERLYRGSGD